MPTALASWDDADGSYIGMPFAGKGPSGLNATVTNGGILALKISGSGTSLTLNPAWVSPDMTSPLTPAVVDGVMFTASGGKTTPATLYVLDASSGQPLWSSGKTITAPLSGAPIWLGAGQVYVATADDNVYAFGFSEERYSTPSTGQ